MTDPSPLDQFRATVQGCRGVKSEIFLTAADAYTWEESEMMRHGHRETVETCVICRDLRRCADLAVNLGMLRVVPSR